MNDCFRSTAAVETPVGRSVHFDKYLIERFTLCFGYEYKHKHYERSGTGGKNPERNVRSGFVGNELVKLRHTEPNRTGKHCIHGSSNGLYVGGKYFTENGERNRRKPDGVKYNVNHDDGQRDPSDSIHIDTLLIEEEVQSHGECSNSTSNRGNEQQWTTSYTIDDRRRKRRSDELYHGHNDG
uniref:Uncharacterized protein n=1 Tax=Anopheles minimus TaxID=112268 RepID=A0A182WJ82_9DIPT